MRYRQSLNLTQETDYINVLDSLNVSNSATTSNIRNKNDSNTQYSKLLFENSLVENKSKIIFSEASSIEILSHGIVIISVYLFII